LGNRRACCSSGSGDRPCRIRPPQLTERRLGMQAVGHHEFEDEHVG
jgi:hypothetical protein